MALINRRLPCFGRGAVFSCLGGGASADSPSAFLFVEHIIVVVPVRSRPFDTSIEHNVSLEYGST
jgi:hypothetical protein